MHVARKVPLGHHGIMICAMTAAEALAAYAAS